MVFLPFGPGAPLIMGFAAIIAALLLHDISTSLDNPPTFTTVEVEPFPVKSKNLIPAAYPDLQSGYWDLDFNTVFSACASVARRTEHWNVTLVDKSNGRVEAVATTPTFKFKDDVAIRVTSNTYQTVVDMRSVSRVGVGDFGKNAERIRKFMADLGAALKRT